SGWGGGGSGGGGSGGGGSAATTGGSGGGVVSAGAAVSGFGGGGSKTTSIPLLAIGSSNRGGLPVSNNTSNVRQTACPPTDSIKGSLMLLTSGRPPRRPETLSRTRPD